MPANFPFFLCVGQSQSRGCQRRFLENAAKLESNIVNTKKVSEEETSKQAAPGAAQLARLTKREKQVLFWVVEGKTNGDIGRILEISPRTVEKHCESIFRKLGIENRYAAIVFALTSNWDLSTD